MFYIILFLQGIMSFFHPCIFSMMPIYLGYITSGLDVDSKGYKKNVIINSILFMLGVWTTFLILSVLFSIVGTALSIYKDYLIIFGGLFISLFGLHHLGVIHIKYFHYHPDVGSGATKVKNKYLSSFLLGLTISFSWTPCVGPVLSSILVLITTHGKILIALLQMLVYITGWTIPFIVTALFSVKFIKWFNSNDNFMKYIQIISGILILITGLHLTFSQVRVMYVRNNLDDIYSKNFITNNEEISLKNMIDHKTVIFFLDSSCNACIEEVKDINNFSKKDLDINVLAVVKSKDYPQEMIDKLNIKVIYDKDLELFTYYDIKTTPSYIILNTDGEVKVNVIGMMNEKKLISELKKVK